METTNDNVNQLLRDAMLMHLFPCREKRASVCMELPTLMGCLATETLCHLLKQKCALESRATTGLGDGRVEVESNLLKAVLVNAVLTCHFMLSSQNTDKILHSVSKTLLQNVSWG